MIHLYNMDNMFFKTTEMYDLIFADYIYENLDFAWVDKYWYHLKHGGVFIAMTDYHSEDEMGMKLKSMPDAQRVSKLVWKNEWGNHPKDRFHQCYDVAIIYSKGTHKQFESSRIQVPKKTVTKGLNPSGRLTKTATAWIDDICLTTVSKERIKTSSGKLIKWQKPVALMQRYCDPFINEGDNVLDLFMGSGTLGEWCVINNINYTGIEYDNETFELAQERICDLFYERSAS